MVSQEAIELLVLSCISKAYEGFHGSFGNAEPVCSIELVFLWVLEHMSRAVVLTQFLKNDMYCAILSR